MKKWALLVALLYGLILILIAWPVAKSAFIPLEVTEDVITITKSEVLKSFSKIDLGGFLSWQFLVALTIMVVSQLALLVVPVDIAEKRPVTKRRLVFPIVTAGLMGALLVTGLVVSISEFLIKNEEQAGLALFTLSSPDSNANLKEIFSQPTFVRAIGVFIFAWLLWGLIFFRWTRNIKPEGLIEKQCRLLYRGSILELLVAVPTHVIARSRDYCCAGASTFIGIVLGISVMLFSFGPGVFFLFADRWKKLHPKKQNSKK
ncbi:MAG: hypothetical protein Q8O01_03735 [Candidatus Omnitrophota bacterium]|nr:hypothetical protein [Candidatus Omnitrophota bacterium]